MYVIVGSGIAGVSCAEAIRQFSDERIIMISDEDTHPYARPLISELIASEISEDDLYFKGKTFYKDLQVEFINGKVTKVLPKERIVVTEGERIPYKKLLVATGASPKRIEGSDLFGVFTLRNLSDAKEIISYLLNCKKAVVLGAGLVGLKISLALKKRGLFVKMVASSDRILRNSQNRKSSEIIRRILEENGMEIMVSESVERFLGKDKVEGILTKSGKEIEADIVIIAKGVSPNTDFIKPGGISVSDKMETEFPNIFCAGDAALIYDVTVGKRISNAIWPLAKAGGKVAGLNMVGKDATLFPSFGMNSIEFFGKRVISMGNLSPDSPFSKIEDEGKDHYFCIYLKDDVIIGAIFLGCVRYSGIFRALIASGKRFKKEFLENPILAFSEISWM